MTMVFFLKRGKLALSEQGQATLAEIEQRLTVEQADGQRIYPARKDWFNALEALTPEQVKVVIVGQDPYHGEGQAHGYAFSVPAGVKPPPSLVNIYKALALEIDGFDTPKAWHAYGLGRAGGYCC